MHIVFLPDMHVQEDLEEVLWVDFVPWHHIIQIGTLVLHVKITDMVVRYFTDLIITKKTHPQKNSPFGNTFGGKFLNIKQEVEDVAILDRVILSLRPEFTVFTGAGFATKFNIVFG